MANDLLDCFVGNLPPLAGVVGADVLLCILEHGIVGGQFCKLLNLLEPEPGGLKEIFEPDLKVGGISEGLAVHPRLPNTPFPLECAGFEKGVASGDFLDPREPGTPDRRVGRTEGTEQDP